MKTIRVMNPGKEGDIDVTALSQADLRELRDRLAADVVRINGQLDDWETRPVKERYGDRSWYGKAMAARHKLVSNLKAVDRELSDRRVARREQQPDTYQAQQAKSDQSRKVNLQQVETMLRSGGPNAIAQHIVRLENQCDRQRDVAQEQCRQRNLYRRLASDAIRALVKAGLPEARDLVERVRTEDEGLVALILSETEAAPC
jgi:ribosomal 50S subunit-associated protein YjgA (DUF615 family)